MGIAFSWRKVLDLIIKGLVMSLSKYQLAGLKSLCLVSLFFAFVPLAIIGVIAPQGLQTALFLGGSYFVPLIIWAIFLSNIAGRLATQRRFYAFLFSMGGVGFAIACSWVLGNFINPGAVSAGHMDSMGVSLPAFALLLFFGVPLGFIAGFFFLGHLEKPGPGTKNRDGGS